MNISPFKLERYFAKYEFSTEYLLCSSDCESVSVKDLLKFEPESEQQLKGLWLGYTESEGNPSLRKQICEIYQNMSPENILVHSGAEEAIFLFMHALLERGDHVIVHWACYQSLFEVAKSIGCQVTKWKGDEQKGWALDLDELKNSIKENTKVIIVNTPHNPTGFLMSKNDFHELNSIVQEKGIILFSDEVYRESEYDASERLPAACDINETAMSLGVMSKTYGLAGLRIGWIATRNKAVFQRAAALKDYTTICNSAPSEFLAELALKHREKLIDRNLNIIKSNISLLEKFFADHKSIFKWHQPKAGSIAFPKLLKGDIDSFCESLVQKEGVLLLPGTLYGDDENHFRIGFGRKNMPEALEKLEQFLDYL